MQVVSCLQNSANDHMMAPADADSDCGHAHGADGGEGAEEEKDMGAAGAGPRKHARMHQGAAAGAEADTTTSSSGADESGEEEEGEADSEVGGCDLVFPASYAPALAQLLGAHDAGGVPVRSIRLPSTEEKLGLAYTLWSEGVLSTVPRQPGKA